MNKRLKEFLGDELYKTLEDKGINVKDIDVIPNNYVPKNRFDEVNSKVSALTGKVETYENQINETTALLKETNVENVKELVGNFEKLQNNTNETIRQKDLMISNIKKTSMVKEHLTKSGARHIDLLLKAIDLDKISIENDKLLGITDIEKELKTEYKTLFVEEKNNAKAPVDTSNNNDNDDNNNKNNLGIFGSLLNNSKL